MQTERSGNPATRSLRQARDVKLIVRMILQPQTRSSQFQVGLPSAIARSHQARACLKTGSLLPSLVAGHLRARHRRSCWTWRKLSTLLATISCANKRIYNIGCRFSSTSCGRILKIALKHRLKRPVCVCLVSVICVPGGEHTHR